MKALKFTGYVAWNLGIMFGLALVGFGAVAMIGGSLDAAEAGGLLGFSIGSLVAAMVR